MLYIYMYFQDAKHCIFYYIIIFNPTYKNHIFIYVYTPILKYTHIPFHTCVFWAKVEGNILYRSAPFFVAAFARRSLPALKRAKHPRERRIGTRFFFDGLNIHRSSGWAVWMVEKSIATVTVIFVGCVSTDAGFFCHCQQLSHFYWGCN